MWTANLSNGEVRKDGILVGSFYSGHGAGKNNPALENVHEFGPIPRGSWTIAGPPFDHADHGPYCLRLEPEKETVTFGRTGFLWHGDSVQHPGEASKGCMISLYIVRMRVHQSGDTRLEVIST